MNIIWNIIKKDLRHYWLTLCLIYIADVVYYTAHKWPGLWGQSYTPLAFDSIKLAAGIATGVLSLAFIGAVIQDDPAAAPSSFWRTRPLTSFQMFFAKGLLLGGVLLVGPGILNYLAVSFVKRSFFSVHLNAYFFHILFVWGAFLTVSAAVAATTKNLSQYILVAIMGFLGSAVLSVYLSKGRHLVPSGNLASDQNNVTAVVISALGAAAFLQQYITRRTWLSLILLLFCPVALALLRIFWA